MKTWLRSFVLSAFVFLAFQSQTNAQTTYDFGTTASLSYGDAGFNVWYTQANITVDGVNYKMTSGGNGSFTNQGTGGVSNSRVLRKEGSGGDVFTIQRNDGQPFKFYGFWVKHQSMNNYAQFYSLPPFYTITYYKSDGTTETYNDNTPMQGGTSPGTYTTSSTSFTKDLTVTSVSINFKAIIYYWIDDIIVGPAVVAPSISTQPVSKNICAGSNTTFSVTASNATGYQWQVNTGSGFTNITNSAPYSGATTSTLSLTGATTGMSTYQYRCVVNGSGSVTSTAATLTVKSVSTSGSQTNISCFGGSNGVATVTPSGGTPPYSYSWSPSGGTAATATGLSAGTYTVTVTDNASCQATRSFTIAQPAAALSATTSKTDVSCFGGANGTATVSASGGTPSYTYSWSPSGGTNATATGLSAGTYTVTITDINSCQTTKTITIAQPAAALSATTSKTDVSCFGGANGTGTVTASGGTAPYTYSWSPSGGTNATATGLSAGTYTVTITDDNNCQATRTITIAQPAAALSATTSKTDVSCFGGANGTGAVTASGGTAPYTYSWSPSGGTNATATGLSAGTYTVTITDANNCQATRTITITQPAAALSATTSKTDVSCFGGANGTATVTASGGTAPYTYSWSPSGGTNATATGLSAGTYTVTITDINSCQTTKTITIAQPAVALSATTSKTDVSCFGGANGTGTLTTSGGTAPYTYSWSPSGGTNATATGLSAGTYTVTITDVNNCQATRTITIAQPAAALSATTSKTDVSCFGGANGTGTVTASGGTAPYTYSWSPSGGTNATATGLSAGTYTVTITDNNSCQTTKTITVTEPPLITATASPVSTNICSGTATDIDLSSNTSGASFTWTVSNVSGNVSGASASSGTSIGQSLSGNGVIRYTITPSKSGCTGTATTVNITVKPLTSIIAHPTNKSIDEEQNTTFSITASNATGYQWQVDMGAGYQNIANGAPYSGATTSTLTITDASGDLHGHRYRCVATGNCSAGVSSNGATLSVRVKATQTITINSTASATYGDADFAPSASSSAALALSFSSSDNNIASIVDGKIHIKKAGEVTITASQVGDNDFKPAAPVTQLLTIARKNISVTLNATPAITKVYDGTRSASLEAENYSVEGVVDGDEVSVESTSAYADKNAAESKLISVTELSLRGADNENYNLTTTGGSVSGTITKREITLSVSSASSISKEYDRNRNASISAQQYILGNVVSDDEVSVSGDALYADKNVGTNKTITANNFTLSGSDKNNYSLVTTSAQATGEITPKELIARFASTPAITKVYDGNATATPAQQNYQLVGTLQGDQVTVSGIASFNDKNVGKSKSVTVENMTLSGADKNNYLLANTSATTSGSITPRMLQLALQQVSLATKTYELKREPSLNKVTYVLSGIIGNDDVKLKDPVTKVTLSQQGTPRGEGVNQLTLIGVDAGNYGIDINSMVNLPASTTGKTSGLSNQSGSKVSDITSEHYVMKAWGVNHQLLHIKVDAPRAQKVALVVYTLSGSPLLLEQKQLNEGVNVFTLQVSSLARGVYLVGVKGQTFNTTQKVRL